MRAAKPDSVGIAPVKKLKLSSRNVRLVSWLRVGITVPVKLAALTRSSRTLPALSHTTCFEFHEHGSFPVHPSVSLLVMPALNACSTAWSDAASPLTLPIPANPTARITTTTTGHNAHFAPARSSFLRI